MTTKRDLIEAAHAEIGLADYVFDLPPEQYSQALHRLDAMMADWNAKGVRVGYNLPSSLKGGDLDDEAGVPDSAWQAIVTNLALRIAPSFGKQVTPQTQSAAKMSLNLLMGNEPPRERSLGRIPAGQGNKPWRYNRDPFLTPPPEPLETGSDGDLEFY